MMGLFKAMIVFAMLLGSATLVSAQYGGATAYPNCVTCPSGTYVSNNAPTYWNCYGTGSLCTYTGQSTTSSVSTSVSTSVATTVPLTTPNSTSSSAKSSTTSVATTIPQTTVTPITYPNCNSCTSGTYASSNAPTYWNCYGTGSLCTYTGAPASSTGGIRTYAYGLMGLIALIAIVLLVMMKSMPTRLAVIGVALMLIGTVGWVSGDYAQGSGFIMYGAAGVIIGWIIWLYADKGLLKNKSVGKLVAVGAILSLLGTATWLYGDYHLGINPTYVWAGVALILAGTIIWLLADKKIGAFARGKK